MRRVMLILTLLLACGGAQADPISIVVALAPYIGGALAAGVATAVGAVSAYGVYAAAAYSVYSGLRARSAAKKAERQAKADYNAALQSRTVTALSEAPPDRYVYGPGIFGGDVVSVFTSDKVKEDGSVKPDGYKHLVIVNAAHRIKAIKDILIDGVRLGITGTTGWATHAEFAKADGGTQREVVAGNLRTATLNSYSGGRIVGGAMQPQVIAVSVARDFVGIGPGHQQIVPPGAYSLSGTTLTLPDTVGGVTMTSDWTWYISYGFFGGATSRVFASKFLGSSTQTADAYLMGVVPAEWTSTDRLQGRAGVVITLDLEEPRFQGGIPNITFDLEGSDEVYDPRDGLTKYTTNAALVTDDYLRKRLLVTPNVAATIVAANACDVSTTFTTLTYPSGGVGPPSSASFTGGRYTICGGFSDASDKDSVLLDMARAMAGKVVHGADWRILAGAWTVPVRDIVDGDDMGPVQILQAGEAIEELFNGVRGSFIPYGDVGTADFNPPYQNATFVAADGEELWEDITLPYTDNGARARNIARVMVEQSRNGLVIVYPAKLKHWDLEVGQRTRVTNAEYGWDRKEFQVLNWDFSPEGAVMLTMQEDNEGAYDLADAAVADPTPNTGLPSPHLVPPLASITLAASTAELLRRADGTIVARVRVTWPASTAAYMQNGQIEVAWQVPAQDAANWSLFGAGGRDTEALIEGVREWQTVMVRLTAINSIGTRSAPIFGAVGVVGKAAPPANVAGLSAVTAPGAVLVTRTPSTEADYDRTEFRYGASFAAGTRLPGVGDNRSHSWPWPSAGTYTIWAVDYDTTGNASTPVSTSVVVDSSILIGAGGIDAPPEWLNSYVSVGGRNLLVGASNGTGWSFTNRAGTEFWTSTAAVGETGYIYSTYITLPGNVEVTLTFESKQDGPVNGTPDWYLLPDNYAAVGLSSDEYPATTDWTKNSFTFTTPAAWGAGVSVRLRIDHNGSPGAALRTYYARDIQLEYGNKATTWTPPVEDVKAATDAAATTADWTGVGGRPKSYRVGAFGASATGRPMGSDLLDADTNTALLSGGAMYRVGKIHRTTKTVTDLGAFSPLSGALGPLGECNAMAVVLNSIGSDHICVVFTYDEPATNRMLGNLPAAMYRNGASRAVWGSSAFAYRGAYILVGIGGCGEGNGAENYAGAFTSDPAAWCDTSFQISALGALTVSGASRGATTLLDYGYTGNLNASAGPTLINSANCTITGSTVEKTSGGSGWTAGFHSKDSFSGGAYVSFVAATAGSYGVGLNDNPSSSASYEDIAYWCYLDFGGGIYRYVNGVGVATGYTWAVGDVLAVTYDGATARWFRNGAEIATYADSYTGPLYADGTFSTLNSAVTNVQFGPMSSIASPLAAAANAQSTADGKIDSFYQTSAPGSASEGDIWFDTDDGNRQYVRVGGSWVVAADTRIGTAIIAAAGAQATADGKVVTFYQSSAPTATAVGDLWFNTTAGSERVSRWNGSAWVVSTVLGTGDVSTSQIAGGAATAITQDTYDFGGGGVGTGATVQRTVNVTPAVACTINFSASITASGVLPDSGSYLYWAVSAGGGADVFLAACGSSSSTRMTFPAITSFTASAGVSLAFKLISDRAFGNPSLLLYASSIRIEEIKR